MLKNQFPIMWYEGMLLEPPIFQQNFLYHENKITKLMENSQPHQWGVINLKIDDSYLSNGIINVKSFECVLPDFSIIAFPNNADQTLSIDLKPHIDLIKKSEILLFLTVPDNHCSYNSNTQNARYSQKEIGSVTDLHNMESNSNIMVLAANYSLRVGDIPPLGYCAIPIAKIKYNGINFQLSEYAPPAFKITQFIELRLQNLVKLGRNKIKYLLNRNENNKHSTSINNIAHVVFTIEKITKNNEHAYALYSHLISCIGPCISFFNSDTLPDIAKYDHNDCLNSIAPLIEYIESAFTQIQEAYSAQLFARENTMFATMLPQSTQEYITVGVSKQPNSNIESTIKWFENAIIASEDKLITMQDQRITGAARNQIKYSQNLDLKSRDDMFLFSIKLEKAYVTRASMLCILNFDSENIPEDIVLFSTNTAETEP